MPTIKSGILLAATLLATTLFAEESFADLLLYEGYESGGVSSPLTEGADASHYTPNTSAVKYSTAQKRAGTYSAAYYALSGTNERAPLTTNCGSSCISNVSGLSDGVEEAYFEWYEFFQTGYPFASSGQKLFRIGYDNGTYPAEKKEITFATLNSNTNIQISYFCGAWGNSTNCSVDRGVNSNSSMPVNTWVKVGLWVKLNTPGSSDGFLKLYIDDALFLDENNVNIRGTNTKGLNYWWLGGNYSMLNGNTLASSGTRYFDSLSWYSTKPLPPAPVAVPELLLFEGFESGGTSSPLSGSADNAHYTPNTSAVKYSTALKKAGNYSAVSYALSGTNEKAPLTISCSSSCVSATSGQSDGITEGYFEWYEFFETGYPFATSGQKLFRIGYDNGSYPAEKKEITVASLTSNSNLQLSYFCGAWGNSTNCSVDRGVNSGAGIATNTWVKMGLWIKLNTPGSSDGFLKLFKNGTLLLDESNVNIRGTNTKGLNYWWLGGSYSMQSGTLSSSGSRNFDSLAWWTSKPCS